MSSEPETPYGPQPALVPDDVPRVYTNYVLIHPGGMDVTIAMGHQVADGQPKFAVQATMSWEEAKFLISALQNVMDAHEQTFGPVPDVMKTARDALAELQRRQAEAQGGAGNE